MSSERCLAYPSTFDSDICGSPVTGSVLRGGKKRVKDLDLRIEEIKTCAHSEVTGVGRASAKRIRHVERNRSKLTVMYPIRHERHQYQDRCQCEERAE